MIIYPPRVAFTAPTHVNSSSHLLPFVRPLTRKNLSSPLLLGNDQLVIFGGFGSYQGPHSAEEPCLLDDVQIFDPQSRRWLPSHVLNGGFADLVDPPRPRHSHLSAISAGRLFIIGGEESNNIWLDDIHVYDLDEKAWTQQWHYPRPCGTYLNVAACAEQCVRVPTENSRSSGSLLLSPMRSSRSSSPSSPTPSPLSLTATYLDNRSSMPDSLMHNALSHLSYSARPSEEFPCDVYLFSNHNVRVSLSFHALGLHFSFV